MVRFHTYLEAHASTKYHQRGQSGGEEKARTVLVALNVSSTIELCRPETLDAPFSL